MPELPLATPFILVVTAQDAGAQSSKRLLAEAGIKSHVAESVVGAVAIAMEWQFDAVLVAGKGVDLQHVELVLHALAFLEIPKLVCSEAFDESFAISALEAGACCVIRESVSASYLKLQIERLLQGRYRRDVGSSESLNFGPLLLEPRQMTASIRNIALGLTRSEFEILKILALKRGEIVDRESIIRALRYSSLSETARSGDMHVCRLRKKLNELAGNEISIKTFRKRGYQLCT